MQEIKVENITNDSIRHPAFLENGIVADILRLDKIHPVISGNKWFKLKNYLSDFQASGEKGNNHFWRSMVQLILLLQHRHANN